MAEIADITSAIADKVATVDGLPRVTDYVPESINPPAAFINLTRIVEDTPGFESLSVSVDLVVLVARGASPRIGQRNLYDFYRPIADAVNGDLGLDGTQARVVDFTSLSAVEMAGAAYYGGSFEIEVTTPG